MPIFRATRTISSLSIPTTGRKTGKLHTAVVARMEDLAKAQGIAYQRDVIRSGGTDAGAIHQTRRGVYTGGISIPCRYTHSPVEMVDCRDVEACAALVAAFAQDNTLQK